MLKRVVFVIVCFLGVFNAVGEDRYHINVLNEINYQQAQSYPRQWEISKYSYTNPYGQTVVKYFIFAPNIKHSSEIVIEKEKKSPYPWQVRINGSFYFADFDNSSDLRVGDQGVLKYDGDRLYFYKED